MRERVSEMIVKKKYRKKERDVLNVPEKERK